MEHLLWYAAPAADWEREALPIGNGRIGAMVFGGVAADRVCRRCPRRGRTAQ